MSSIKSEKFEEAEEAPKEQSAKDMSLYKSLDFLKELSTLQKLHLVLKDFMDGYFWLSLGKHFFAGFFPGVFFSQVKEKIHLEKTPQNENSS